MNQEFAGDVYLGLGANLGDRQANLEAAVSALSSFVEISGRSPVYQTAPWGYTDQPDFLNQVVCGRPNLSPEKLLSAIKGVEAELGRAPTFRYGPRLIDIDILLYGNLVLVIPGLQIPHPHLHERAFVLLPLADLAPDLCHPLLHRTVRELLESVDSSAVKPLVP